MLSVRPLGGGCIGEVYRAEVEEGTLVAHEAGRLPAEDRLRVERLSEKLDELIEDPSPPALIHGDVWSANVLAKGDRITGFLDPAIYADPEIELAFISLFDSFGRPSSIATRRYGRYAKASSRCAATCTTSTRCWSTRITSAVAICARCGTRWTGSASELGRVSFLCPYSGERDNVVEEIIRIAGTHFVVERGCFIEGRPEPVPIIGHEPSLMDAL